MSSSSTSTSSASSSASSSVSVLSSSCISFSDYISLIGLQTLNDSSSDSDSVTWNTIVDEVLQLPFPSSFSSEEQSSLLSYRVPRNVPGGACSKKDDFEPLPFELDKQIYSNFSEKEMIIVLQRLWRYKQVIQKLQKLVGCEWLGIYRLLNDKTEENGCLYDCLVKESYYGDPSRAYFPLSPSYLLRSNNSYTAYHRICKLVDDTRSYSGPYYICDQLVLSEFCIPILDNSGKNCLGIIDAEAWKEKFFDTKKRIEIAKVCYDLGKANLLQI